MRIVALVTLLGLAAGTAAAQVAQPLDGAWHLTGQVRVTACADRCASRRRTIDKQLVVVNGDLTGADGLESACDGAVSADQFSAATTLVPARHGWLKMKIVDRARFVGLMRTCIGYRSLRLSRVSSKVRVAADGLSFDEVVRLAGSVTVRGQNVSFSGGGRAHGAWVGTADTAAERGAPSRTLLGALVDAAVPAD
jgi:hypothetical protein